MQLHFTQEYENNNIVTLSEPLNCWGLLISMFTQTKGLS